MLTNSRPRDPCPMKLWPARNSARPVSLLGRVSVISLLGESARNLSENKRCFHRFCIFRVGSTEERGAMRRGAEGIIMASPLTTISLTS